MRPVILLQARTNSSRLPGKVLLPIEGLPVVVLAALRAASTGHRVMVVTSQENSDDELSDVLDSHNVECFRGDLNNTLKRFVDALEGEPDDQIVVRLTGDNVVPDGTLIDEVLEDFRNRNLKYLCCGGEGSGLPYGVSLEVMFAGDLRGALRESKLLSDLEHVTPPIISKYGRVSFKRHIGYAMASYRCTIDTLDDYLRVCRMFKDSDNPVALSLDSLLKKLREISELTVVGKPCPRLVLGTAQLGFPYGIVNVVGKPDYDQARNIVHTAISNGVIYLDTARAYKDSEAILGRALSEGWSSRASVVTKLSPLSECVENTATDTVKLYVERSFYQSCQALNTNYLDVMLLHRADHLWSWGGAVIESLSVFKDNGQLGRVGVSIQSPDEALRVLDCADVEFLQLPFNILDGRWAQVVKRICDIKRSRPLTVHVRSVLLQGLLTSSDSELWQRANCYESLKVIEWLTDKANTLTNGNVPELCIRFVASLDWVDGVVLGVETLEQLTENLTILDCPLWGTEVISSIVKDRPKLSSDTLNPSKWSVS